MQQAQLHTPQLALSPSQHHGRSAARFDCPMQASGQSTVTAVRHLWPEPGQSAAPASSGDTKSDTSNTSMDSTDTATMRNQEAGHPVGTHSNPIQSSVLSKPSWNMPPPQTPAQSVPQNGSISCPLSSSIINSPHHSHQGGHPAYLDRSPSGHYYQVSQQPPMSNMTFVPTAQGPAPVLTRSSSVGATAAETAAGHKADSPPPTIQEAAAATAAAADQAVAYSRSRRRAGSVERSISHGRTEKARSSRFRGVTKHRRSGRWEAHIWVKELGRQVYLGGYEHEEHAAEAYDVAALKCKGSRVKTNFAADRYSDLTECMDSISLEELIMAVRRQSQGFSRGTSTYRGVTHHPSGRWEARIGIPGSKHIYLGLFNEEKEAAQAYDRALVRLRGTASATNFALSDYRPDLAEYHKMQQTVLQSDKDITAVLGTGQNFERWIKHGSTADDLINNSADSDEPPPLGTVAGVGGVLREVVRKRTGGRSKSRSRSPGSAAAKTDADDGINSGSEGEWQVPGTPQVTRSGRTVVPPQAS